MISVWRVYDRGPRPPGRAYLVERLWPRGVSRDAAALDGWLKDVSPSPELRRWYAHDPAKWDEFTQRYFAELDARPDSWRPLLDGDVVLVYSARDRERNSAMALRTYLLSRAER